MNFDKIKNINKNNLQIKNNSLLNNHGPNKQEVNINNFMNHNQKNLPISNKSSYHNNY